jgi:hypothetical protein
MPTAWPIYPESGATNETRLADRGRRPNSGKLQGKRPRGHYYSVKCCALRRRAERAEARGVGASFEWCSLCRVGSRAARTDNQGCGGDIPRVPSADISRRQSEF